MLEPHIRDTDFTLYVGDVRAVLAQLEPESVDCIVTSPPYWNLRDYGTGSWAGGDPGCDHISPEKRSHAGEGLAAWSAENARGGAHTAADLQTMQYRGMCGSCGATRVDQQIGLEQTPGEYVTAMVDVFRECRSVLAPHGTLWLNLGDSYVSVPGGQHQGANGQMADRSVVKARAQVKDSNATRALPDAAQKRPPSVMGLKPKDLVGIPWRVAFALQQDGWWLRSDIIWAKPNPMPESVTDRPTKAHEYVFLLTKQPRYYFDQEAVREPAEWARWGAQNGAGKYAGENSGAAMIQSRTKMELRKKAEGSGRNIRTVWEIATQPYPEAHFATFPLELARRCILAGCPEQVCRTCGKPRERTILSTAVDTSRPQARRALEIARNAGLTDQHFAAMRESGIAGDSAATYEHAVRGHVSSDQLVAEAKEALGGYYREFLMEKPTAFGLSDCGHDDYRPGIVLDPFMGAGTTALVARHLARHSIGIELNPAYADLIATRLQQLSLLT